MAGFDWVVFENDDYIRLSVIPDSELGGRDGVREERREEGRKGGRREVGGRREEGGTYIERK